MPRRGSILCTFKRLQETSRLVKSKRIGQFMI